MSFFTDLFTSYSPFQEKVAACSDEQLEAPDMLANLEICDVVSVSKPAAKVRAALDEFSVCRRL